MKYTICLLTFLFASMVMHAQNTITATFNAGDIPTNCVYCEQDGSCINSLVLALPAGENYTVTSVDVAYSMTALGNSWKSQQRSSIGFQNSSIFEDEVSGSGETPGVQSYARSLAIANGTYPGGTELVFNMSARRLVHTTAGCNDTEQRVNASTWTITVHYGNEVTNAKVGINTISPSQTMDVAGKIKLADDTTIPSAGTVRWNASTNDFEGYNGTNWVSFTKTEGDNWGDRSIKEKVAAVAPDGAQNDYFGESVSISGDYAIVGAFFKDIGANGDQGKAYIYKRSGNSWTFQDSIKAPDGAADDQFGWSVSISGDYAIVGAIEKNVGANGGQGKAYIYMRSGNSWTYQADMLAHDGSAFDHFGSSVSISGDYAIVGAIGKNVGVNNNQGKAYIYKRSGNSWIHQADILAPDGASGDQFGWSVSISGDHTIVGVFGKNVEDNLDQGKAYIYKRSGNSWILEAGIVAPDGAADDEFGWSVSISSGHAIVGARYNDVGTNIDQGKAYIFRKSGTAWILEAGIVAPDGAADDEFGHSVSISGDYAIVGANFTDIGANGSQGKTNIYKRSGTKWMHQAGIIASDGESADYFGKSVAISGEHVIVGAYGTDVGANVNQGKVYFYSRQ